MVIQQLPEELRDAVCVFYLVLRALDTVEDDMALPNDWKVPMLKMFYTRISDRSAARSSSPPLDRARTLTRLLWRSPHNCAFARHQCFHIISQPVCILACVGVYHLQLTDSRGRCSHGTPAHFTK